jgi:hypothetical protein
MLRLIGMSVVSLEQNQTRDQTNDVVDAGQCVLIAKRVANATPRAATLLRHHAHWHAYGFFWSRIRRGTTRMMM